MLTETGSYSSQSSRPISRHHLRIYAKSKRKLPTLKIHAPTTIVITMFVANGSLINCCKGATF